MEGIFFCAYKCEALHTWMLMAMCVNFSGGKENTAFDLQLLYFTVIYVYFLLGEQMNFVGKITLCILLAKNLQNSIGNAWI